MPAVVEDLVEHSATDFYEIEGMNPAPSWWGKWQIFFMSAVLAESLEHSTTDCCEIEGMNPDTAWEEKIARKFLCQQW